MIDLMIDAPYRPEAACGCGDEECLLDSPMLRLIKERNEARELLKRVLLATEGMTDSKEYYAAMLAAHCAVMTWKEGQ
jgi:hypothetical protein